MKCELFYKCKKPKSEFREALRAAFDEYESSIVKQIENDIDIDLMSVMLQINDFENTVSKCSCHTFKI
jgi:tRNA(Phe) wybutosine-synthesizing methylase Tyw3